MSKLTIGEKIQKFRKNANLSQLDLEFKIEAASGSISRIESNQVNPTKETLEKISKVLNLNKLQQSYLFEIASDPVSESEISEAKRLIAEHYNDPKNIGFLLDDRWFVFDVSKGFIEFLDLSEDEVNKMIGRNIMELLFDPISPLMKYLENEYYSDFAEFILSRKKEEIEYMSHEPWMKNLLERMSTYPEFKRAWPIVLQNPRECLSNESRTMYFNVEGEIIPLLFGREVLKRSPRFYIIEYARIN